MSLWRCPTHGLTGPMACCAEASRAAIVTLGPSVHSNETYSGLVAAMRAHYGIVGGPREAVDGDVGFQSPNKEQPHD